MRVTAGDKSESQTFVVKRDPRTEATQADLDEQYAFSDADPGPEQRGQQRGAHHPERQDPARRPEGTGRARGAALARLAQTLESQLSAAEEEIYQVGTASGQDPLNYPIKLNNQIAGLAGVVASAEAKPTKQSYEVFDLLSAQLKVQLDRMQAALGRAAVGGQRRAGPSRPAPIAPAPEPAPGADLVRGRLRCGRSAASQ